MAESKEKKFNSKKNDDFMEHLFKTNNELLNKVHSLEREIFNKNVLIENLEDDIRSLKVSNGTKETDTKFNIPEKEGHVIENTSVF
jgi:hypothetical protein